MQDVGDENHPLVYVTIYNIYK